jgi:hypothetical protein
MEIRISPSVYHNRGIIWKPFRLPHRATALTFFGVKIPLQAVFFEEKIYRKVEKVKEGGQKRALK